VTNVESITFPQNELITYDHNNLNQLIKSSPPDKLFLFDDGGNMTRGFTSDGYAFDAKYDAENRQTSIEYLDNGGNTHRTEYTYKGDSLLAQIKKYENAVLQSDVRIVRSGFLALQERNENNEIEREYTWDPNAPGGIGGLLNLRVGGIDISYLYDGKGNVTALQDATQNIVAAYRYDEFGNLMAKTGTLDQAFMFSTKRYDVQTGLSYFGYRFYSPAIGKWITRDPIEESGGINLYAYVLNNPVNLIDPWGLQSGSIAFRPEYDPGWNEFGGAGGGAGAGIGLGIGIGLGGIALWNENDDISEGNDTTETIEVTTEPKDTIDLTNDPDACTTRYLICKAGCLQRSCDKNAYTKCMLKTCLPRYLMCLLSNLL
jgi:RHS repeat-associated protein